MRTCTKCKEIKNKSCFYVRRQRKPGSLYSLCKKCHEFLSHKGRKYSEYPEKYKIRKRRYALKYLKNKKNKVKIEARKLYLKAIKDGIIKRKPCIICATVKSEGHHYDYTKPLNVIWVCKRHHADIHFNGLIIKT